ncbi:uncharacterized protein LOC133192369 [Saccostrea echinata]|uniref:uncharacterized protein LOC133192369 n=1 Tax=Saccostrea echinata TaxID=191078 RepID=UPI002A7F2152|nr:uncharacterized protein LOC133192369 [Saccostrea echinata]
MQQNSSVSAMSSTIKGTLVLAGNGDNRLNVRGSVRSYNAKTMHTEAKNLHASKNKGFFMFSSTLTQSKDTSSEVTKITNSVTPISQTDSVTSDITNSIQTKSVQSNTNRTTEGSEGPFKEQKTSIAQIQTTEMGSVVPSITKDLSKKPTDVLNQINTSRFMIPSTTTLRVPYSSPSSVSSIKNTSTGAIKPSKTISGTNLSNKKTNDIPVSSTLLISIAETSTKQTDITTNQNKKTTENYSNDVTSQDFTEQKSNFETSTIGITSLPSTVMKSSIQHSIHNLSSEPKSITSITEIRNESGVSVTQPSWEASRSTIYKNRNTQQTFSSLLGNKDKTKQVRPATQTLSPSDRYLTSNSEERTAASSPPNYITTATTSNPSAVETSTSPTKNTILTSVEMDKSTFYESKTQETTVKVSTSPNPTLMPTISTWDSTREVNSVIQHQTSLTKMSTINDYTLSTRKQGNISSSKKIQLITNQQSTIEVTNDSSVESSTTGNEKSTTAALVHGSKSPVTDQSLSSKKLPVASTSVNSPLPSKNSMSTKLISTTSTGKKQTNVIDSTGGKTVLVNTQSSSIDKISFSHFARTTLPTNLSTDYNSNRTNESTTIDEYATTRTKMTSADISSIQQTHAQETSTSVITSEAFFSTSNLPISFSKTNLMPTMDTSTKSTTGQQISNSQSSTPFESSIVPFSTHRTTQMRLTKSTNKESSRPEKLTSVGTTNKATSIETSVIHKHQSQSTAGVILSNLTSSGIKYTKNFSTKTEENYSTTQVNTSSNTFQSATAIPSEQTSSSVVEMSSPGMTTKEGYSTTEVKNSPKTFQSATTIPSEQTTSSVVELSTPSMSTRNGYSTTEVKSSTNTFHLATKIPSEQTTSTAVELSSPGMTTKEGYLTTHVKSSTNTFQSATTIPSEQTSSSVVEFSSPGMTTKEGYSTTEVISSSNTFQSATTIPSEQTTSSAVELSTPSMSTRNGYSTTGVKSSTNTFQSATTIPSEQTTSTAVELSSPGMTTKEGYPTTHVKSSTNTFQSATTIPSEQTSSSVVKLSSPGMTTKEGYSTTEVKSSPNTFQSAATISSGQTTSSVVELPSPGMTTQASLTGVTSVFLSHDSSTTEESSELVNDNITISTDKAIISTSTTQNNALVPSTEEKSTSSTDESTLFTTLLGIESSTTGNFSVNTWFVTLPETSNAQRTQDITNDNTVSQELHSSTRIPVHITAPLLTEETSTESTEETLNNHSITNTIDNATTSTFHSPSTSQPVKSTEIQYSTTHLIHMASVESTDEESSISEKNNFAVTTDQALSVASSITTTQEPLLTSTSSEILYTSPTTYEEGTTENKLTERSSTKVDSTREGNSLTTAVQSAKTDSEHTAFPTDEFSSMTAQTYFTETNNVSTTNESSGSTESQTTITPNQPIATKVVTLPNTQLTDSTGEETTMFEMSSTAGTVSVNTLSRTEEPNTESSSITIDISTSETRETNPLENQFTTDHTKETSTVKQSPNVHTNHPVHTSTINGPENSITTEELSIFHTTETTPSQQKTIRTTDNVFGETTMEFSVTRESTKPRASSAIYSSSETITSSLNETDTTLVTTPMQYSSVSRESTQNLAKETSMQPPVGEHLTTMKSEKEELEITTEDINTEATTIHKETDYSSVTDLTPQKISAFVSNQPTAENTNSTATIPPSASTNITNESIHERITVSNSKTYSTTETENSTVIGNSYTYTTSHDLSHSTSIHKDTANSTIHSSNSNINTTTTLPSKEVSTVVSTIKDLTITTIKPHKSTALPVETSLWVTESNTGPSTVESATHDNSNAPTKNTSYSPFVTSKLTATHKLTNIVTGQTTEPVHTPSVQSSIVNDKTFEGLITTRSASIQTRMSTDKKERSKITTEVLSSTVASTKQSKYSESSLASLTPAIQTVTMATTESTGTPNTGSAYFEFAILIWISGKFSASLQRNLTFMNEIKFLVKDNFLPSKYRQSTIFNLQVFAITEGSIKVHVQSKVFVQTLRRMNITVGDLVRNVADQVDSVEFSTISTSHGNIYDNKEDIRREFINHENDTECEAVGICDSTEECTSSVNNYTAILCNLHRSVCSLECGPNGACVNSSGIFHCRCKSNWLNIYYGLHCESRAVSLEAQLGITFGCLGVLMIFIFIVCLVRSRNRNKESYYEGDAVGGWRGFNGGDSRWSTFSGRYSTREVPYKRSLRDGKYLVPAHDPFGSGRMTRPGLYLPRNDGVDTSFIDSVPSYSKFNLDADFTIRRPVVSKEPSAIYLNNQSWRFTGYTNTAFYKFVEERTHL